ncbi:meiotic recombination protein SPO11-like isoform X2 [Penaeus japonicus]|uniref:meiotic recombination protein SPO11-like isoform X2 n=1 Tax=Penaeus japonicus TaxID=27405 RepID=UPI001C70B4AC|nr:meiotic recombination protein SPO11-like isoform X2 [Penaeus japonicus]
MAVNQEFWRELEKLNQLFLRDYELYGHVDTSIINAEDIDRATKEGCERVVESVVASLTSGECPVLRVPRSHRRDVFYENVWLYGTQSTLDRAAEDLSRLLGVPRRGLHLTATGKGLVAGSLAYTTHDGTTIDVSQAQQGMLVPECVQGLSGVASEARYILVVEKDATFQKLVEAQFHRSFGPAVFITGKGYPDLLTRQLVFRLWAELRVPVLALTDADPYGLHIAAIYKFGSLAREEPGLAVPSLAWLGVLPSDLPALQLPAHALLPLTPTDHGKLATLAAHPLVSKCPAWLQQIHDQQKSGYKAEIQSLTHIAQDYLTSFYIPSKIRQGGWIT